MATKTLIRSSAAAAALLAAALPASHAGPASPEARVTTAGATTTAHPPASGSRVGYAPFVLSPTELGEHRIAVVMPTQTWQAYNFRDDDGDGHPDTWYAGWKTKTARLVRPFLNRGVPPHWTRYDAPFVRWLVQTHRHVDYLSDAELRDV